MEKINVVNLTKNAIAQTMGTEYMEQIGDLAALDSAKLIDVGKDVIDSGSVDAFVKSLLVQMGEMYIESREYVSELSSLYVHSFDWGGFVERIMVSPVIETLMEDPVWNITNGTSYADIEHTAYIPECSAKIFEEGKPICVPMTKQTSTLFEAFQNMNQLTRFVSALDGVMRNTIKVAMDSYAHMLVSAGIAISEKALGNAYHFLTEAKAKGIVDATTTPEKALENEAYIIYVMRRIRDIKKYMGRLTTAFNNGNVPMQSLDTKTILLTEFVSSAKFNVRANTYHLDEIEGIGPFDEVSAWQGVTDGSDNFAYANNSKIMIAADPTNKLGIGTSAVTLSNAIGICFDKMAMGLTLDRVKVTSSYTAATDMQNFFTHALVNYLIDTNYSIVAFFND